MTRYDRISTGTKFTYFKINFNTNFRHASCCMKVLLLKEWLIELEGMVLSNGKSGKKNNILSKG